ncbi:hypothetical protein CF069_13300 [Clostridium botulinum]
MKELTLRDLDKLDIIEITNNELVKIRNWCLQNENIIYDNKDKLKDIFDKIVFKERDIIVYYEVKKSIINFSVYKIFNTDLAPLIYSINSEFSLDIGIKIFLKNYYKLHQHVNVDICKSDFYKYCKNDCDIGNKEALEYIQLYLIDYYSVLIYFQLNQESIIRQTRNHTKKIQSKKDKRKGKKPRIKLIKQNIIKINTEHIQLTEEERNHYDRHTFGWTVRGHWREYQSGKKVWIKPQIRGDKSRVEGKIYEI